MNKLINNNTFMGRVCALAGIIIFCGGFEEKHISWAYECLGGWHLIRQCLLGYLIVPLTAHNQTETSHWPIPLNLHY